MPDETKSKGSSFGAKIAQAAAGRKARNTANRQRRLRRVNNRKSFLFSSEEAIAGMRITHRHQKEAQPEGQHDDIQHEVLLVPRLFPGATVARSGKKFCDGSRTIDVWQVGHIFSRGVVRQRYRKVVNCFMAELPLSTHSGA